MGAPEIPPKATLCGHPGERAATSETALAEDICHSELPARLSAPSLGGGDPRRPRAPLGAGPLLPPGRGLRSHQRRAEAQAWAASGGEFTPPSPTPRRRGDWLLVLRPRSAPVVGSVPGSAAWGLSAALPVSRKPPSRPVQAEEGPSPPLCLIASHPPPPPAPAPAPAAVGRHRRAPRAWGHRLAVSSSLHSQQAGTDRTVTPRFTGEEAGSEARPRPGQRSPGAERVRTSSAEAAFRRGREPRRAGPTSQAGGSRGCEGAAHCRARGSPVETVVAGKALVPTAGVFYPGPSLASVSPTVRIPRISHWGAGTPASLPNGRGRPLFPWAGPLWRGAPRSSA